MCSYQVVHLMKEMLRNMSRRWQPGQSFTILFWCRSGRHRSVASVVICRAILRALDIEVTTEHLCSYYMMLTKCQRDFRRQRRTECPDCVDGWSEDKDRLLTSIVAQVLSGRA